MEADPTAADAGQDLRPLVLIIDDDARSRFYISKTLLRHYPELEPALRGVDNPFAPWRAVA